MVGVWGWLVNKWWGYRACIKSNRSGEVKVWWGSRGDGGLGVMGVKGVVGVKGVEV